ncbi:MAG: hypothetical protein GY799_21415 [Desulfobulbaceae bacterium]|nr:hypothetical protein [Desulfobulbaceae bacterium]
MGTNYIAYAKELERERDKTKRGIERVTKELVEDIFNMLTGSPPFGTPVKTGWASAGWRVAMNAPTRGAVKDTGNVASARTFSARSLSNFLNLKDFSTLRRVFIDNRVSYITKLNNGSSKQSPSDFIDLAVQYGHAKLYGKRIKL